MSGHLYFHSPCFDGIASAVLASDFLEARRGWSSPDLRPVNYGSRREWVSNPLSRPAAVVDFLYHPDAVFFADHHPTTFLTEEHERDFRRRRRSPGKEDALLLYDPDAPACARMLWDHLGRDLEGRNGRYEELVRWAEKIDAARYGSVREALFSDAPAMRIEASLAVAVGEDCVELVRRLRNASLETVAALPAVEERFARARQLTQAGLERFRAGATETEEGIVVFDVERAEGALIPRYAPYFFFPDARYSVGIVRGESRDRVTAMRNPWREFESVPLGRIFERLGGGGHRRIGSVVLSREGETTGRMTPGEVLDEVLSEIRNQERVGTSGG